MSVMNCPHCNQDGHSDGLCHQGAYYVRVSSAGSVWLCERGEGQRGSCSDCVKAAQERDGKNYHASWSTGFLNRQIYDHDDQGLVACGYCHGNKMVLVDEQGRCFPFSRGT